MNNLTLENLPSNVNELRKELSEIKSLILETKKEPQQNQERILTVHQAAEFLNISPATVYSKISRNELPYMKRSKRVYFSSVELINYLKKGRNKSDEEIEEEAEANLVANKKGGAK